MDPVMQLANDALAAELRRAQVHGHNLVNAATPGYKRAIAFETALADAQRPSAPAPGALHYDLSAGVVRMTEAALDLVVDGGWLAVVRDSQHGLMSSGAFARDADGALLTADGWALADEQGVPLSVRGHVISIESDGTVLGDGLPVARLQPQRIRDGAVVSALDGGALAVAAADREPAAMARVRSGMTEAANVNSGAEMVRLMEAVRRAETGQKVIHVYDDLMGGALQRLGDL